MWHRQFRPLLAGLTLVFLLPSCGRETLSLDADDLGGQVTGSNGPEAGVWVIAETTDLPTRFNKIVVTDEEGRYLLPDLPEARYRVWVRGYGLIDSPPVETSPGRHLDLETVAAPDTKTAAQYYPAGYWFSLLEPPAREEFPGTGPAGNGIPENIRSQAQWLRLIMRDGCWPCHQIGNKATREIPAALGSFTSSQEAWARRIESGQSGGNMVGRLGTMGRARTLAVLADWTDRIAGGEVPPAPPRPQGVERNLVITQWDWSKPQAYLHDEIATDKRNPTVNGYGPIYGAPEFSTDEMPVLNPTAHRSSHVTVPVRDADTPSATERPVLQPSPYWGAEVIWDSQANLHNPMMDHRGRVWLTATIRAPDNPDFCKEGSAHPSARIFPIESSDRHLTMYDPADGKFTLIDTCFRTHHLQFAEDDDHTLWTSGGGRTQVVGWLNTRHFEETGDAAASQGWTGLVLDINGNGRQDDFVGPDEDIDPGRDKRVGGGFYGVIPSPVDDSVWGSAHGFPGYIARLDLGANPPATALTEIYEPPWNNPGAPVQGFSPRGIDIDRNGVVWTGLASGHFASFDRSRCQGPLNGPTATGQHCPEGWTLYPMPGPRFSAETDIATVEFSYYNWVDQFDTLGLGANVPIATGNGSDSLLALVNEEWVILRVPYPLGFYAKGLDGRIDNPEGGWKGRGLWSTYATRTPFHLEGGTGTTSKVVHFQLRPHPLAK